MKKERIEKEIFKCIISRGGSIFVKLTFQFWIYILDHNIKTISYMELRISEEMLSKTPSFLTYLRHHICLCLSWSYSWSVTSFVWESCLHLPWGMFEIPTQKGYPSPDASMQERRAFRSSCLILGVRERSLLALPKTKCLLSGF